MSKITLEPNDSGAGTFSIVSPDSNINRTLNLPDASGTLLNTDADGNIAVNGINYENNSDTRISLDSNFIRLFTNDSEQFTVDDNGDVGIGISSPNAKLDVGGSLITRQYTQKRPQGDFDGTGRDPAGNQTLKIATLTVSGQHPHIVKVVVSSIRGTAERHFNAYLTGGTSSGGFYSYFSVDNSSYTISIDRTDDDTFDINVQLNDSSTYFIFSAWIDLLSNSDRVDFT